MAIHPIEYRYGTPEMKSIWETENKLQRKLDVESALAQAEGKLGIIPQEVADEIADKAYNISKELFLIGKISITDLNQALASKDMAKQSYVSTLRDFWTAYYQLREKTLYDFENSQLLVRDLQINSK